MGSSVMILRKCMDLGINIRHDDTNEYLLGQIEAREKKKVAVVASNCAPGNEPIRVRLEINPELANVKKGDL